VLHDGVRCRRTGESFAFNSPFHFFSFTEFASSLPPSVPIFCLQIPDITDSVSFSLGVSVAIARSFDIGYNHIQFVSLSAILTSICCALVLVEYDSSAVVAVKLFLHRLVVLMFRSACLVFVLQPHVNERKEILIFWLGFGSLSLLGFVQGDPLCGRDSVSGNDNSIKSSGRLSAGVIKQQHPKLVEVSFFSFSD